MPTKTYYLDEARTEPLTVSWGWLYRNFTLSYRGQPLVPFIAGASLAQGGYRYELPDGRNFSAQLRRNVCLQEVELLLDGRPLPGSNSHPLERLKQGWYTLLLVSGLNMALGVLALISNSEVFTALGMGWPSIGQGLLYLGLGWWGFSRRAAVAFYVALGLLVLDWVFVLATLVQVGASGGIGGIFIRFILFLLVYRAARAAQDLRREVTKAPPLA